jgi:hypothetical protein
MNLAMNQRLTPRGTTPPNHFKKFVDPFCQCQAQYEIRAISGTRIAFRGPFSPLRPARLLSYPGDRHSLTYLCLAELVKIQDWKMDPERNLT